MKNCERKDNRNYKNGHWTAMYDRKKTSTCRKYNQSLNALAVNDLCAVLA